MFQLINKNRFLLLLIAFQFPIIALLAQQDYKLDLGGDRLLCVGETVKLDAGIENVQYAWNTGATSKVLTVDEPGYYEVIVETSAGTYSDGIYVDVDPNSDKKELTYYITPNDDGVNDTFQLFDSFLSVDEFSFSLFNSCGEKVYYSTAANFVWNGINSNNEMLTSGMYFYKAKYLSDCDEKEISGLLELMR